MTSKFLEVLATFSRKEVKVFRLYLQSPLFKIRSRESCLALFNYFVKKAKVKGDCYDYSVVKREETIKAVLGKVASDKGESLLNFYLSHLYQALEGYLQHTLLHQVDNELWEETLQSKLRYIGYLEKKQLHVLFQKKVKEFQKEIEATKLSEKRYCIEWQMAKLLGEYIYRNPDKRKQDNLSNQVQLYQKYNILTTLKIVCQQSNRQQTKVVHIENIFPNRGFTEQEKYLLEDPLIKLYYQIYLCIKEEATITDLLRDIKIEAAKISMEEIELLTIYVENYCIKKIRNNELSYAETYIELSKFLDEVSLLSQKITIRYFVNTVRIVSMTNAFEWGKMFIENYAVYLSVEIREQYKGICQGLLAFEQGKFEQTLTSLLEVHLKQDPVLEINRRSLIIKAYYETNNHAYLETHINTYIQYLEKQQLIPEAQKKMYKNFHQYLKKLYKLRADKSYLRKPEIQEKIQKLIEQIEGKKMVNKVWLLEKVGEVR